MIAPHRVATIESVVANRAVLVDGIIVETHVLYPQDLPVWQGGMTEQARLFLDGTPWVQLGVSIHLTVGFLAVAPEAELVAYRVTTPEKIRVILPYRKLPLPALLE